MATLANRAKVTTATTGTGTITLGSAVSGFQTFAAAGVSNGATVSYVIEEGTAWEVGTGTYSSTGPTLTRTPSESSNAGAAINLAGAAQVYVTAIAGDLQNAADMNQGVATTDSPTFAGATVNGNITVTGTVDGRDVASDGTKLDGIEAGATADQTAAEIKTAYESNANTNAFTDAEQTKLAGIEAGATADQTAAEIKTAYESNVNTNAFTDTEQSKLAGIEAGADVTDTANVTAAGALMDSEVTNLAAVKAFNPSDYATAAQGALADSATQPGDNISTLTNDAGYTTNVGDITGVTAGSGLTGGGTSGDVTVSHADTSAQGSVNNSGTTVIQDVTLDTYGHVTGLASKTITSSDLGAAAYDTATSSTGFFALPNGTTAQRPGSPANGYIRYNSTIGGIEEYNNGSWSTISQIFTGATGGSVTTSGSYTIHTFTSSGTFTVSGGAVNVEYLVIGGGGGGATQASSDNRGGGGGGAGGYRTNVSGQTSGGNSSAEGTKNLAIGSYTVTVGGGGAGGSGGYYVYGSSGSSSAFDNITSSGGGRGGHGNGGNPSSGGSGGGGGSGASPTNGASGTSGQGFGGGNGVSSGSHTGGTGGGAGGAGTNAQSGVGIRRAGGAGLSSNITGSSVTRAVGGGSLNGDNEQSGGANTGTGGDGGGGTSAGSGGSGIVIIRYLTP